jgi:lactate racemase
MDILRLRTAAWYGDRLVTVPVPASWQVTILGPRPAPAMTDAQIIERFESPAGQRCIRELARGKARPVVIVDDLNRPTPAARVIPTILNQFHDAGIPAREVSIVMAPGTHGAPRPDALVKKVGAEAASACRLSVHDCDRDLIRIGRTSFGTPVLVNRQVAESDFLIGVGGLYPNWTAGFGGGTKLAMGILGFESIAGLHFGHQSMGWGTPNNRSNFRRDLDEIARMIGLQTTVSLVLNADREVVEVCCGDTRTSHTSALQLAREAFRAPVPTDGMDVVVSNAYPSDLSLTFVRMKGMRPVTAARASTSKVVVAACSEGVGFHGLFPMMNVSTQHRRRLTALKARILLRNPHRLVPKVLARVSRQLRRVAPAEGKPTWLFRPDATDAAGLPSQIAGINVISSWEEVVEAVDREQGRRDQLRVAVYPCAALQWLG